MGPEDTIAAHTPARICVPRPAAFVDASATFAEHRGEMPGKSRGTPVATSIGPQGACYARSTIRGSGARSDIDPAGLRRLRSVVRLLSADRPLPGVPLPAGRRIVRRHLPRRRGGDVRVDARPEDDARGAGNGGAGRARVAAAARPARDGDDRAGGRSARAAGPPLRDADGGGSRLPPRNLAGGGRGGPGPPPPARPQ